MSITAHGLTAKLNHGLSPREAQCLLAVAAGLTSKQVARDLGIAPGTVEKRLLAATTKMGVTRRAALVAEAFKCGLVTLACSMAPGQEPSDQHQDKTQGIFIA